jgi:uncharacterized repeat protein (TIGR01451 family)
VSTLVQRVRLPILTLAVLAAGVATAYTQQIDFPSTPKRSAPTTDLVPPRPEWNIKQRSNQQAPEEQALPQIGGIVSVGLNVEISRLFAGTSGSGFIPPDTMAAVGPNHIVEMINGNFEIINKTTGASIQTMSLDAFWTNVVGLAQINSGRFDPRIVFDPASGRWFALSIDRGIDNVPPGGDGTLEVANNYYIARSDTSDPTGDWDGVTFNADSTGALEFHDYPTLGLDADGLYSCTQDFNGGGNESCYSIPKADLLLAAPTAANRTTFEATPAGLPAVDGSWQPAVNRGLSLGRAPVLGTTGGALRRTNIFGATAAGATLGADVAIAGDPGHGNPPAARQPDDSDTGDGLETIENVAPRFVSNVVVVGGSIWAVHAVEGPAAGANSGLRWYEINEATNTVVQWGDIDDANIDYHEPSIAVNQFGTVVIGSTCSGPNLAASACVSVGTTTAGVTTFLPPAIVFAGSGTYYRDFCTPPGCSERNRWGDYSSVVVDPSDPGTFWVFQEYTAQDAGNIDVGPGEAEGGLWGIRAVELTFIDQTGGDLAVQKTCEPASGLFVGQTGFCEVSVTNFGPEPMLDVVLTDRFLSSGTFTFPNPTAGGITTTKGSCAATPNPQVQDGTVTCNLGRLIPNETVLIHVDVSASTAHTVNDTATATSESADSNPGNNQAGGSLVFIAAADLSITKTDNPDPVVAGMNLTFNITVTNNGPSSATNVVASDLLPSTLSLVSVTGSGGATCNAGIPGSVPTSCAFGTLANGDSRTMTIVALVDPSLASGSIITNNANVSSATADNNNANNLATTTTLVNASANLGITKSDSPDPVLAGANLTYVLTVTNAGPSWARDVFTFDTLPAGVSFVSATIGGGSGGVCSALAGSPTVVQCSLGDIENGGIRTITMQTLVASSVPHGTVITNNASVTSTTPDPVGGNNTTSAHTTVNAQADLWVDKTGQILTGNPSNAIRFTLTVYNRPGCEADDALSCGTGGPSDAQNVVVTDTLPLDPKKIKVIFVSQNCTYSTLTHKVTCTLPGVLPAGQSASFTVDIQTQGSVGTISNTMSATSTTFDPNLVNNTDVVQMKLKGGNKNP